MKPDRLSYVLDATYECLSLYGARRTTMDDIASRTGLSRSSLYTYVRNKDEALRLLAERLHRQALGAAEEAARAAADPTDRVTGVLTAKLDLLVALSGDSPHAVELLDQHTRLFGDICTTFSERLRTLLIEIFTEAGAARPPDAADICLTFVRGLETAPEQAHLMNDAVRALVNGLTYLEKP